MSNYSFPSRLRLTKPAEFKNVFAEPVKFTDRYFTLLARSSDFTYPRVGLAIAKKIIKKAVHRNVIKRTVRESFRLKQHSLGNVDIVVLVRNDAQNATPEHLRKSLEKHWQRIASRCVPS